MNTRNSFTVKNFYQVFRQSEASVGFGNPKSDLSFWKFSVGGINSQFLRNSTENEILQRCRRIRHRNQLNIARKQGNFRLRSNKKTSDLAGSVRSFCGLWFITSIQLYFVCTYRSYWINIKNLRKTRPGSITVANAGDWRASAGSSQLNAKHATCEKGHA